MSLYLTTFFEKSLCFAYRRICAILEWTHCRGKILQICAQIVQDVVYNQVIDDDLRHSYSFYEHNKLMEPYKLFIDLKFGMIP